MYVGVGFLCVCGLVRYTADVGCSNDITAECLLTTQQACVYGISDIRASFYGTRIRWGRPLALAPVFMAEGGVGASDGTYTGVYGTR